jgi:GNAT superfamily N-acetyltransferase
MKMRRATSRDASWIIPLSARLHDFGPPAWRPRHLMDRAVAAELRQAFTGPEVGTVLLVAEDGEHEPLGFAYVHTDCDLFTGERHAHLSELAVRASAEGRGVGAELLGTVERWAVTEGHRLLTLNVFATNHRARSLYERSGFLPDTVKLVKEMR